MDLQEIKVRIEKKFKHPLPSHIFLDRMRVIDEESRKSFAYNDATYVPFYYWLGTCLNSTSMIEIGLRLGLLSGNFVKSCKTLKRFFAVQEIKNDEFYSPRLAKSNIRDSYKGETFIHIGNLNDDIFETKYKAVEFDLAIINEETDYDKHRYYFDLLWPQISDNGIIVAEYLKKHRPAGMAFKDFCKSKNREPVYVDTNYGVGLIKK